MCQVLDCEEEATVSCGTWLFCTKHAIETAKVVIDEAGWGAGIWGTAHARPNVVTEIREKQIGSPMVDFYRQMTNQFKELVERYDNSV